ncbi:unnamed protein product [Urochloa humidicola]
MLGVGLGVRLLAAASPARPAPAPPGKPILPLSSSLRRRSASWWFSSGNAHERDSAAASTSSREARRKWWSDPEPSQQEYGYSSLEDEEDYEYEDEDEAAFPGLGGAAELFDEPWFSKVFKTYGYLLPVMLVSMFAATGPKAFLMAMAIPLGQSAISFLLDAIWGRRRSKRDDRWSSPFQEEEEDYPDDTTDFATGGRGNRYTSSRSYNEGRRKQSYQSWVSNDFAGAAADDNNSTKSSSSEGGEGKKSSGNFGGWDEILDDDNVATQEKRRGSSFSAGNTDYRKRPRPAVTGEENTNSYAADRGVGQGLGAPPARMRMRQQRGMPRTAGLGSTRYKQAPLLMRLLVAVFPFMGSWFRLL